MSTPDRCVARRALPGMLLALALLLPTRPAVAHEPLAAQTVLVFGGSGQLGAEIVRELVEEGHDVFAFVRPTSNRARLAGLPVQLIEGDVRVEADVRRALESRHFNVVVNALGRSESDVGFYATSGRHIARWSQQTRVDQVILHSSVGVGRSAAVYPAERLGAMRALFAAKEVAESELLQGGPSYTIIRNAVLRDLAPGAKDGAELVPGDTAFGVVTRRGLARLTRECLRSSACENRVFHAVDSGIPWPEAAR